MSDLQPKQPPTVGRIVHFHRPGAPVSEPLAAIIAKVFPASPDAPGQVTLQVIGPETGPWLEVACYSAEPAPGRWNYPPYVAPAILEKLEASLPPQAAEEQAVLPNEKPTVPPPADHPE